MTTVNYQKRKNAELFKSLENPATMFLSECQNYVPFYNSFFALNETNYNNINFNHELFLTSVGNKLEDDMNIYNCSLKCLSTNKPKRRDVFFKYAPLLDPYKFLIGKYAGQDISVLPDFHLAAHPKFNDVNNTAYVDGLFTYLSSKLIYDYNFVHGVDYYGSFLAFKCDLQLDILDDYEHLSDSDYFKKHTNVDFFMKDLSKLPPITINYDSNHELVITELDDEYFASDKMDDELKEVILDELLEETENVVKTVRSDSTCSSRSSHTSCSDPSKVDDFEDHDDDFDGDSLIVTIPKFPVHVIALECCDATLDDLILDSELKTDDEWHSAFMQIFMILITYQKAFGLTHNDLHTNNVMFVETKKKHLCYLFNGKYYKVPTYGRLFKIIAFGRSIYKVNGKRFCSDSFKLGGDAATQYNTEPFMDETKPRIEPNYSFDICRLACSIYDYIIRDDDVGQNIKDLVQTWCTDDKGANVIYKTNGQERYPDFKLYKMIARTVHHHTPQIQLIRPEFQKYEVFKGETQNVMDVDAIPVY
jgi:hypothetical protein